MKEKGGEVVAVGKVVAGVAAAGARPGGGDDDAAGGEEDADRAVPSHLYG